MKPFAIALILALPVAAAGAQTPTGVHKEKAPAAEPMKRFSWRDEAAGYTFVAPPRWAGAVKAVPLSSKELARSGATSGVRFMSGGKVVLELLAADDKRANALATAGATELARHDDHVVAVKASPAGGPLALTHEELAAAVQWDGATEGTADR